MGEKGLAGAAVVCRHKSPTVGRHIGLSLFEFFEAANEVSVCVEEVGHRGDEVNARRNFDEHRFERLEVLVGFEAKLETFEPLVAVLVDCNLLGLQKLSCYTVVIVGIVNFIIRIS